MRIRLFYILVNFLPFLVFFPSFHGQIATQFFEYFFYIFFLLLQFSYDMFDGSNRVIQNHPRTSPTHHFAHSFFHLGAIAVDGALLASWLVFTKLASFQSCSSVL